jgi:hypothetical protein
MRHEDRSWCVHEGVLLYYAIALHTAALQLCFLGHTPSPCHYIPLTLHFSVHSNNVKPPPHTHLSSVMRMFQVWCGHLGAPECGVVGVWLTALGGLQSVAAIMPQPVAAASGATPQQADVEVKGTVRVCVCGGGRRGLWLTAHGVVVVVHTV